MSLESFNKLMTHELTLKKRERNSSGDFSVIETTAGLNGFIEFGNHLITTDKGEEFKSTAIVFISHDVVSIDINHEYWMIDQTSPYNRPNLEVLKIDPIDDPRTGKTHHYEIHVR